jgi:hypothetical protein
MCITMVTSKSNPIALKFKDLVHDVLEFHLHGPQARPCLN